MLNPSNPNRFASVEKSLTRQPSCRSLIDQLNHNCVVHDLSFSPKYGLIVTLLKVSTGVLINVDISGLKDSAVTLSTGVATPRHAVSPSILLALRPSVKALILDVLKTVKTDDCEEVRDLYEWEEEKLCKLLYDWRKYYRKDDGDWYDNLKSACTSDLLDSVDSEIERRLPPLSTDTDTETDGKPPIDEKFELIIE